MEFTEAIRSCLAKFATFSGRASRSEFWWFVLFLVFSSFALSVLDMLLWDTQSYLSTIFSLVMFLPGLAVGFRRLQDGGRSGWLALIPYGLWLLTLLGIFGGIAYFGPRATSGAEGLGAAYGAALVGVAAAAIAQIVAAILLLWWCTRPSEPRPNRWGPVPLR